MNGHKGTAGVFFTGLALCVQLCGAQVLNWDAALQPSSLGSGALAFTYDGEGRVKTVVATPEAGESIVLNGDDMSFAANAKVSIAARGELVFDVGASAVDDLTVDASAPGRQFSVVSMMSDPVYRDEVVEVRELNSVDLNDYRLDQMLFNTRASGRVIIAANTPAHPCHQVVSNANGRTYLDAQIHNDALDTTKWLKCVKVRLVQDSDGTTVQVLWAKYADRAECGDGFDFENPGQVTVNNGSVPTSGGGDGGYTIDMLRLQRVAIDDDVRCVFRKVVALPGDLIVTNGVTAVAQGVQGLFNDGSAVANDINVYGGQISFADRKNMSLAGRVGGRCGHVSFCGDTHVVPESLVYRLAEASDEIKNATWRTALENARLSAMTNAVSRLTNSGLSASDACRYFNYVNDGRTASVDVQNYYATTADAHNPGLVRGSTLELRQNGTSVEIRRSRSYFLSHVEREDFDAGKVSYESYGAQTGDYWLTNVDLYFAEDPYLGQVDVVLSNANSCESGSLVFGTDAEHVLYDISIAHPDAFPTNGQVHVYGEQSRMSVTHSTQVSPTGTGWSASVFMHDGSTLECANTYAIGARGPHVELDHGVAKLKGTDSTVNYANAFALKGASIDAGIIFCGYAYDGVWTIRGDEASTVSAAEIRVAAASSKAGSWILDVADVNDSSDADIVINAPITRHSNTAAFPDARVVKRGEGTVMLTRALSAEIASVRLESGMLLLGADQCCNSANDNIVLAGGALGVGAGVNATVGQIRLLGDSRVVLESGATLALAAQSPDRWESGILSISGPSRPRREVRFGNSASGLTAAQLRRIRYNDQEELMLDDSGYLRVGKPGIVLFVR